MLNAPGYPAIGQGTQIGFTLSDLGKRPVRAILAEVQLVMGAIRLLPDDHGVYRGRSPRELNRR